MCEPLPMPSGWSLVFGGCAFLPVSLGPAGDCPCNTASTDSRGCGNTVFYIRRRAQVQSVALRLSSTSWRGCALRPAGRRWPACSACERAGPGGAVHASQPRLAALTGGLCCPTRCADGRARRARACALRPAAPSLSLHDMTVSVRAAPSSSSVH
jgi:hypothetical protein